MKADKCPVCEGRGTVPVGFYEEGNYTGTAKQSCRSCGGFGYVIVPEDKIFPEINPLNPGGYDSLHS